MYDWTPSTSGWANPSSYEFDSARAPYLGKIAAAASARGPRTYSAKTSPDPLADPGKLIHSDSKNPLVIAVDVTGSMSEWPQEIFDRLPLVYQTLSQYNNDIDISFCAIGDANCDSYPLQVTDFAKGLDLEDKLKALCPEGGGGGQIKESYELFGYYMLNKCEMKNATSPFLLIYGDEKFYPTIDPAQVKHYVGDKIQSPLDSNEMWKSLTQKFNVYYLHKKYDSGSSSVDREVVEAWSDAIGRQRIIEVPSVERAVDVAIGLIAKSWGEYDDFTKSLSARHPDPSEQMSVHRTLRYIDGSKSHDSVMSGTDSKSRRSKPLM